MMEKENIKAEDIQEENRTDMELESILNMCSWGEFN
jgi:hypothetical protein